MFKLKNLDQNGEELLSKSRQLKSRRISDVFGFEISEGAHRIHNMRMIGVSNLD